jgi:Secretion system C-terminal sorting domain
MLVHATHDSNITLQVMNLTGQIISSQSLQLKAGDNSLSFDISKLQVGMYSANIYNAQTKTESVNPFIKE